MDAATRRRLIAQKSPIQGKLDDRPKCEDCGLPLTREDFHAFWDGQEPMDMVRGAKSKEEAAARITPRICGECNDKHETGEL